MTGGHNPAATPDHEGAPRLDPAVRTSAEMREAWVRWAVAMLEEE